MSIGGSISHPPWCELSAFSVAWLLRRFLTVDEVAAMTTYIASEAASGTNGSAIRVDGGVIRAIL